MKKQNQKLLIAILILVLLGLVVMQYTKKPQGKPILPGVPTPTDYMADIKTEA